MRKIFAILVLSNVFGHAAGAEPMPVKTSTDRIADEIISLERSALDRWINTDPQGYLDLYADEVTYFDPMTQERVDGLAAMQERLAPMKGMKIPFKDVRYQMINPRVVQYEDVVLLTFNLINYGTALNQSAETILARWNSTEIYQRIGGRWKIIHSHWSFTKPDVEQPGI